MTRTYKENISIHAPRVGCDIRPYGLARPSIHFNPRTPGGVRPIYDLCVSLYQLEFQSTHPGWGATRGTLAISKAGLIFQSTHPGWGATQLRTRDFQEVLISIHAPRVGCDFARDSSAVEKPFDFNPRTPGGVRPNIDIRWVGLMYISIHAPRVGCDSPQDFLSRPL